MTRLGYTDYPNPQPAPPGWANVGQAVRSAAPAPLLIDGQLIRLGGETFPLTAISGVFGCRLGI
jgi:hypothetical protein